MNFLTFQLVTVLTNLNLKFCKLSKNVLHDVFKLMDMKKCDQRLKILLKNLLFRITSYKWNSS